MKEEIEYRYCPQAVQDCHFGLKERHFPAVGKTAVAGNMLPTRQRSRHLDPL